MAKVALIRVSNINGLRSGSLITIGGQMLFVRNVLQIAKAIIVERGQHG